MALSEVQRNILRRMYRDNIINEKHTPIENLKRGVPSHMRGEVEKEAHKLIKMGYIVMKKTHHGIDVRLNHEVIAEIEREIGEEYY